MSAARREGGAHHRQGEASRSRRGAGERSKGGDTRGDTTRYAPPSSHGSAGCAETAVARATRRTAEEVMKRGMVRRELRSACGVGGARGCVKNARGFRFFTIRFLHAPVPSCVIPRSRVPVETLGRRHCFLLETRDPPRESRVPMETLGGRHCFLLETRDPQRESRVPMETIGTRLRGMTQEGTGA